MFNLSDNYHLRKCFLQREQVPSQSMMKEKMSPALAAIHFESMSPKHKVLAGLEPKLKGGGHTWYIPPDELLKGRVVLKPISKQVLSKLSGLGVEAIGKAVLQNYRKAMDLEAEEALVESDESWKINIIDKINQLWDDLVAAATRKNTEQILNIFDCFTYLYKRSIGKIEILFHESAIAEIKNTQENAILEMKNKYSTVLKHQATMLYGEYEKRLKEHKAGLKIDFIQKLEVNRTAMGDKIHDLKVDKHMALKSIRQYRQCENLACGVYVALKEREECAIEIEMLERRHKKTVGFMKDTIQMHDFKIRLDEEKHKKREEFRNIWRKKVCHVVKSFQMFVSYCLKMLPEHAEFFINMEKLMLLQLNETLEDPAADSIIEEEREQFHTPVPQPKPFYLFCDRGYKAKVEQDLCPKHSGTSSASGLPVIIVNKRCLYAECDNFEQFSNKIKEFIHGNRGDDADLKDDNIYKHFVPVKYGSSQQRLEIKLQSSLLQVLQQEVEYINEADYTLCGCGLPWCNQYPVPHLPSTSVDDDNKTPKFSSQTLHDCNCIERCLDTDASRHKLQSVTRSAKLDHESEPKWHSFCRHVEPRKCSCAKTAKKHLEENLPSYMRQMRYGPPEIPGYEMCSMKELKKLVKKARKEIRHPVPSIVPSRTKDMSTQYCDPAVEEMCTCYSDDELTKFMNDMQVIGGPKINFDTMSPSFITGRVSSFATSRAQSLRNLVNDFSELSNIFTKVDCDFK